MRHRRRGRKLGRNPNHQRALLRNLASALILTERDAELDGNAPKVTGRIVTTLAKAKEVRPLVERCVTIARRALVHQQTADQLEPDADRHSNQWRAWRESDEYRQWNQAVAPVVAARRRALTLLGSKQAVQILFERDRPAFRGSPRRLHPRLATGQAATRRCRHASDPRVRRTQRPCAIEGVEAHVRDRDGIAQGRGGGPAVRRRSTRRRG